MRFALTREQDDLRSVARSLLERGCPASLVRTAPDGPGVEELWRQLADVGAPGLLVPEDQGGLGLDEVALVVLLTEAGRVALPLPLLETVAWSGPLLAAAARDDLLTPLLRGEVVVAADPAGDGLYPHGRHAEYVLSGGWAGAGRVHLATVASAEREPVTSVDPSRGLVQRTGSDGVPIADGPTVLRAWRRAVLGAAAELVGLGRRMLDMAVEHVRDRHQFGAPVGSFQAVQHRLADALLRLEFAEPAVLGAAHSTAVDSPLAGRDVSMAKALASSAATAVARTALQSHGALGYTVEHDLHLFLKRTWALAEAWGGAGWHRDEIARYLGLVSR